MTPERAIERSYATMNRSRAHPPLNPDDAGRPPRQVFVRDLLLEANIGIHKHERKGPQPVRINLDLWVPEDDRAIEDKLENVVCYEDIVAGVKTVVAAGHVNLVETLAERIAERCLAEPRVGAVRVRVEKLGVIEEAASVGVEIVRARG